MLHSSMQEQSQHRNINNNNNSNTTTLMTSANSKNVNANAEGTKASTQPIGIRSLAASQLEQQHNGQNSRKYNNGDNDSVARGEPARSSSLNAATRAKLKETSTSTGSTNSNTMHSKEDSGIEARRRRCDSSSSGAVTQTGSRNSNRHTSSSSSAKASIGNVGSNVGAGSSTVTTKNPYNNTGDIMTAAKKQGDASSTSSHQQQPPNTASQRNLQSHQNSNTIKSRSSTNPKKNSRERSDDERLSIANDSTEGTARYRRRRSRRISKPTVNNFSSSSSSSSSSSTSSSASSTGSSCNGSCSSDDGDSSTSSGEPNLQYPGFPEVALKYLTQDTRPRNWCLTLITNPWFERISILVILLNCITLGMYQPCVDDDCEFNRCKILQIFDDIIFAFFALEMSIKMVAMGIYGKNTYMADSWNRLDFFIVFAGLLEYVMHVKNLNLTAIRTIRVLRPLRAINRIPSMRILVMLLLDTLPMLGNVLLLCFFVFFIFGIIGVQLWQGILRQRCVLELPDFIRVPLKELPDVYRVRVRVNSVSYYYEFSKEQDYICSTPEDSGMHLCSDLPPYRMGPMICTEEAVPMAENLPTNTSCVDWNLYYSQCKQQGLNPFQGTISFDNIGMAWVAIFLVISLEGWTDIMYYVQDAHSFWDWIYFVLLIVIGSFFMINLCLVVIATQFSETKKREMERMRQERARYTSTSTLASSTNNSEPATCYAEIVKYIAHLWRRFKRRMLKKYRLYKYQQKQRKEGLLPNADNLTFSPSRIKNHHPKCPKYSGNRKPSSIQDQMITVMVPLNSNNNVNSSGNNNNQQLGTQNQLQQLQQNSTTQTPSSMVSLINGHHNAHNSNNNKSQQQHNTSSENSEQSVENAAGGIGGISGRNSNYKKISNQLNSEADNKQQQQKTILLKFPQNLMETDQLITHPCTSGFLSPPTSASRRPSVMFNEYVLLHTPPALKEPQSSVEKTVCSSEKMTQAGDGSIWQVNLPQTLANITNPYAECSDLGIHDAMTCQELLAFSVAFSAALPTGQSTLESFYSSLARCDPHTAEALKNQQNLENTNLALQQQQQQHQHQKHLNEHNKKVYDGLNYNGGAVSGGVAALPSAGTGNYIEDYSCCYDLYQNALSPLDDKRKQRSRLMRIIIAIYRCTTRVFGIGRRYIKRLVEHKYFQQGILLAILINTLSMGIEYHKQPEELTVIVETSNVVFSAIFAVEMLLKVVAEGPFRYIANGFNVFDGVIVILSVIEICQQFTGNGTVGGGGSGLSVLRTFRLLRILKLVRFMPNLRRQLFVMLRTMDNVAVFFSLLVLFIFIFSILGMNLFGCKFCEQVGEDVICDRKNFDSLLWALVTVFQILTQEDWNVVLFNGMEKTSHWAALYFVALMTFGNYVLFNLLVAILVEGFSSERNERREREQRELVKKLREETLAENYSDAMYDESHSEADSSTTNESYYEVHNRWHSAEDIRKHQEAAEMIIEQKSNVQKQRIIQSSSRDQQMKEVIVSAASSNSLGNANRKTSEKDVHKPTGLGGGGVGGAGVGAGVATIGSSTITDEDRRGLKKTYSIRERRSDVPRLAKIRPIREPPIITTTAATPQDSPNTTLETGTTFKNWGQPETNNTECPDSPSLLRPPTLFNSQRSLDEGIPSIDLIPPSPVLSHKSHINILNASQLESNTYNSLNKYGQAAGSSSLLSPTLNGSGGIQSVIIDDISKNSNSSAGPIYVPTISSTAAKLQLPSFTNTGNDACSVTGTAVLPSPPTVLSSNVQESAEPLQRLPSLKRFRRNSSKRKKAETLTAEDVEHQLNNGSDNSCLLTDSPSVKAEMFLKPTTPNLSIKNKDTNRLSPQNSIRRLSTSLSIGSGPGSRRASACLFNSHMYQNLNQPSKLYSTPGKRRMSSIELAFTKTSHLNLHNLEPSRKSLSYTNSKLDLDKWQKSYAGIGDTDMLQQYMQERERRKNSISQYPKKINEQSKDQQHPTASHSERMSKIKFLIKRLIPRDFSNERKSYSLYIFPESNRFRRVCTWFVNQKWFDNLVLLFIALNCITLAMERPNIPPYSTERLFLATANYIFTVVFTVEMLIKVVATGMFYGSDAYFTSGWNIMDGSLVTISIVDLLMSLISQSSPRIFGILRVFRLLRSLRPLRVINRAPGLKLVVQTLLSSLRPIGNIVLICCTFFIIFGILGVQLFKGTFYFCEGENIKHVRNKTDCLSIPGNAWVNRKYNFDDLGKALMSLFVLSSRDGWVNIMYTGLDAVGIDQQPIVNYNEWRLLYFIAFILLVGFFVLNMFVGVVVENFHRCREEQEKEEKIRRAAKRALQMEKKRRRMHEPPYYINYSPSRMFVHNVVTSKYFDLAIAAVIGLNVVTMAMEYYKMPPALQYALKIFNYFFTAVFILEANMKLVALGWHLYLKDKWNQLDVSIVLLSIVGIVLEELETKKLPINPTIIRVMRVLRIARVLKLLKMAKGIRALLDTVMQALPQVGNLGLLFFLLFFIFAALGVELFGRLECSEEIPCQGLGEHAHFANFGMAFLTLFRVATGDNWNGIMKDTLRDNCDDAPDCVRNCCVSSVIAPIFFVIFVLMAQFVLVNVVVAVLMKHLEESHKQMEDEMDMEVELERELVREQEFEQEQKLCEQLQQQTKPPAPAQRQLGKVKSLPMNFTYNTPTLEKKISGAFSANNNRRQTVQYFNQQNGLGLAEMGGAFKTQALTQLIPESAVTEENSFDSKLQIPATARRGRRCSTALRKRGMLTKERSLDEQAIRRRTLESKRMSSDSLPWGGDVVEFHSGTIFESLESDGSPSSTYDVHSIRSEEVPRSVSDVASIVSAVVSEKPASATPSSAATTRRPYGRSISTDPTFSGPARTNLLSVPRSMPPRSRSGSTKQLFKQQALDEDHDMDESSLLLPVVMESATDANTTNRNENSTNLDTNARLSADIAVVEGLSKSDSAEILRIISERRRIDQRDNSGNEDSDYNELLLVKSPQSSIDG